MPLHDFLSLKVLINQGVLGINNFTLTTGVDTTGVLKGDAGTIVTTGNDNFIADETASAMVSLADTINGGAGNDTLTIYNSKGVAPQLSGVETVLLNTIADSVNFDASSATGLTTLSVKSAGGTNNFTVGAGTSVSLASTVIDAGADGAADINVVYAAAATSANLTLNAVTSAHADSSLGITGAALTTLNIATTGAASTIQELEIGGNAAGNSSKIASLILTGDKKLTITEGVDLLTAVANTIDSTGLTGDLDLGTGVAALDAKQDLTFKGGNGVNTVTFVDVNVDASITATFGSGKDVITLTDATGSVSINTGAGDDSLTISELDSKFNATDKETASFNLGDGDDTLTVATGVTEANLASGVTLDGGNGTDTLKIYNAEYLKLFDATTDIAVTGFETLYTANGGTFDVSKVAGISKINVAGIANGAAASYTNLSAAQATNVNLITDPTTGDALTVALKDATGTADVLTLTVAHATANTAITNDAMVVTGFETVNIVNSNGTGTISSKIATGAAVTALNLSGAGTGTHTVNTANLSALKTFDASGASGVVALTTAASQAATFTLSGYADTVALTASTGAATFNLGAGKDKITGAQADIAAASINGGADSDTLVINNDAGTTATLTINDATFANISDVQVLDVGSSNLGATTWTLGGYANAIAAANGGVLTITATTTGGTDDADGYTINSTGLATANAIDLTIKDTAVTAAKTNFLNVTAGAGADKITLSEATASSVATITVDAGAGNNTVTTTAILGKTDITTAGGADAVKVTTAATGAGKVVIATGAGADSITVVGTGTAAANYVNSITAGTGADSITLTDSTGTAAAYSVNKVIIAAGDSTTAAYDSITGFYVAGSTRKVDTLDLPSTTLATATAAADGTDYGAIKAHTISAGGLIKFDDVNTYAAELIVNSSNLTDVLGYLAANITTAGDTVAFQYDSDNSGTSDATFVFQANATSNILVLLTGVTGTALGAAAATANLIGLV